MATIQTTLGNVNQDAAVQGTQNQDIVTTPYVSRNDPDHPFNTNKLVDKVASVLGEGNQGLRFSTVIDLHLSEDVKALGDLLKGSHGNARMTSKDTHSFMCEVCIPRKTFNALLAYVKKPKRGAVKPFLEKCVKDTEKSEVTDLSLAGLVMANMKFDFHEVKKFFAFLKDLSKDKTATNELAAKLTDPTEMFPGLEDLEEEKVLEEVMEVFKEEVENWIKERVKAGDGLTQKQEDEEEEYRYGAVRSQVQAEGEKKKKKEEEEKERAKQEAREQEQEEEKKKKEEEDKKKKEEAAKKKKEANDAKKKKEDEARAAADKNDDDDEVQVLEGNQQPVGNRQKNTPPNSSKDFNPIAAAHHAPSYLANNPEKRVNEGSQDRIRVDVGKYRGGPADIREVSSIEEMMDFLGKEFGNEFLQANPPKVGESLDIQTQKFNSFAWTNILPKVLETEDYNALGLQILSNTAAAIAANAGAVVPAEVLTMIAMACSNNKVLQDAAIAALKSQPLIVERGFYELAARQFIGMVNTLPDQPALPTDDANATSSMNQFRSKAAMCNIFREILTQGYVGRAHEGIHLIPNGYVEKMYGIILRSFADEGGSFKDRRAIIADRMKSELLWRNELAKPFAKLLNWFLVLAEIRLYVLDRVTEGEELKKAFLDKFDVKEWEKEKGVEKVLGSPVFGDLFCFMLAAGYVTRFYNSNACTANAAVGWVASMKELLTSFAYVFEAALTADTGDRAELQVFSKIGKEGGVGGGIAELLTSLRDRLFPLTALNDHSVESLTALNWGGVAEVRSGDVDDTRLMDIYRTYVLTRHDTKDRGNKSGGGGNMGGGKDNSHHQNNNTNLNNKNNNNPRFHHHKAERRGRDGDSSSSDSPCDYHKTSHPVGLKDRFGRHKTEECPFRSEELCFWYDGNKRRWEPNLSRTNDKRKARVPPLPAITTEESFHEKKRKITEKKKK